MKKQVINSNLELYHHGVQGQKWGVRKEEDEGPKVKVSRILVPAVVAATIGVGLGIIAGRKKYSIMGNDGPIINKGKVACAAALSGIALATAVGIPAMALEQNRAYKEYDKKVQKELEKPSV